MCGFLRPLHPIFLGGRRLRRSRLLEPGRSAPRMRPPRLRLSPSREYSAAPFFIPFSLSPRLAALSEDLTISQPDLERGGGQGRLALEVTRLFSGPWPYPPRRTTVVATVPFIVFVAVLSPLSATAIDPSLLSTSPLQSRHPSPQLLSPPLLSRLDARWFPSRPCPDDIGGQLYTRISSSPRGTRTFLL